MTTDRRDELVSALEDAGDAVQHAEKALDRKPGRREVTKIAVTAAIVISVIMGAVAIGVSTLAISEAARTSADQRAAAKDAETNRKLAESAYSSAQDANRALQNRGQAPVPLPPPGDEDPTDTIVAAATARVLAQLPDTRPTAGQLAQAVAEYFILNPVGPTPGQLSSSLAKYFADNPPPPGPAGPSGQRGAPGQDGQPGADGQPGKDGVDGRTPTAEDIQREFVAYVQANPEFLPQQVCRNYGQNFNQAKDLVAADGTQYTLYGCITEVKPPVTGEPTVTPTEGN